MRTKKEEYVEMGGKKFYPIDFLARQYRVSDWVIRARIKEFGITGIVAFGEQLYPDDQRYARKEVTKPKGKGAATHLPKVSGYADMWMTVKRIDQKLDLILEHLTSNNLKGDKDASDGERLKADSVSA